MKSLFYKLKLRLRQKSSIGYHLKGGLTILLLAGSLVVKADVVDDYITTQMRWQHIPGLSIAVVRDGKIIKAKGYGLANLETGSSATPESVYKIGSVSKQFIAAGTMLLVEEGKIGLEDPLKKYLDDTPESWRSITVRQLLTHTSGIVREAPGFDPLKVQPDIYVIRTTYSLPLRFAPGEHWAYSNINYYCLAEIIRNVTGKPWSEFIADRIFATAAMSSTRTTTTTDIVPHRANGYNSIKNTTTNSDVWLALRPSGAFLSTVLDLAKWDAALYLDAILSASSRAQMWSPVRLNNGTTFNYGFGWFIDSSQGHRRVYHSGGVPGFVCEFDRFIDDKLTIILMANVSNRDLGDVAINVGAFYVPALKPPIDKPIADSEPELAAHVKAVITGLANGNLELSQFTSELASNLTGELKSGSFNDLRRFGPIRSFILIERKNEGNDRTYSYRLTYRQIALFVDCTFNKDNKIVRFALHD